jgi:hypothetical protein
MRRDDVILMSCQNTIWILQNPEEKDGEVAVGKKAISKYLKRYLNDYLVDDKLPAEPSDTRLEIYDVIDSDNLVVYEVPAPLVITNGEYSIFYFIGDLLNSIMKRPLPEYEVPIDVFLKLIE